MGKLNGRGASNQKKFKTVSGQRTTQKHKFYKFQNKDQGERSGEGSKHVRKDGMSDGKVEDTKTFPLDKYRENPLPEILSSPGILVSTTKDREKTAELELIQYLEQIADEIYPETKDSGNGEVSNEDMDFEEMLKRDLDSMKDEKKSERFKLCRRDGPCLIYVVVVPPLDPQRLVQHIFQNAEMTGKYPLRYCKRILPITITARATLRQLNAAAAVIIKPAFYTVDNKPCKFAVDTNSRFSDKLDRMDMIHAVAEEVTKLNGGHIVDLKNPEKTIIVEVCKNNLGVTVLENFRKFKKYNPGAVAVEAAQLSTTQGNSVQLPSSEKVLPDSVHSQHEPEESQHHQNDMKYEYRRRRASFIAHNHVTSNLPKAAMMVYQDDRCGEKILDLEAGEVVEDEDIELGNDWEEVMLNGKLVRFRKDEK
ncbi:uncharacterized protein L203_101454 [Cryptococcus depauperatus CBS 7841]|uniref:Uncharacterized protein n=1 Tax=Cryptococcus depauperatus CBS 7841 TaxID=1295531 RepID=A0A1E3ITP2_9TREE|nr:hypothetical protein L203_01186 [Cryptococcus depauperatus CBS 7841]